MKGDKGTIDDQYLEWLYSQIASVRNRNPHRSYWNLCRRLYSTEFIWSVRNDENRAGDGKELRREFVEVRFLDRADPDWMDLPCSVLEMLIAFCNRLEFQSGVPTIEWFHILLTNLGIDEYSDANYTTFFEEDIDHRVDIFLRREYDRNGVGGLFPLVKAPRDQRKIELWWQMAIYLLDNGYVPGRELA